MNRWVRILQCHEVPFSPGVGNLKNVLQDSEQRGILMRYTDSGVLVDYKGVSFIIPLANVKCATFAEPSDLKSEWAAEQTPKSA